MEFTNKNPKIYIISGKSGSGKTEAVGLIKKICKDKKVIDLAFAYSIKHYTKQITGWDGSEDTKPRSFLQNLGVELIKEKIDSNLVVNGMIEDIKVYSYFFDLIVISDARFIEEIESIRNNFNNVTVIRLIGKENKLTKEEQNHISETALDNYNNYDYVIKNDLIESNLEQSLRDILWEK